MQEYVAINIKALTKALKRVRDLIERLRVSTARSQDHDHDKYVFSDKNGAIGLGGDEAAIYEGCLEALLALHGENLNHRALSRNSVQNLLRDALLYALYSRSGEYPVPRTAFERRLVVAIRALKRGLLAKPREWEINVRVHGFGRDILPFSFGGIQFSVGSQHLGSRLAAAITDFSGSRRIARKRIEAEQKARTELRNKISRLFEGDAVARVFVLAADAMAAKHLGVERVRRAVDVINYFAARLNFPRDRYRAYLPPDGERWSPTSFIRNLETGEASLTEGSRQTFTAVRLRQQCF